jgi:hypothetical protein
VDPGNAFSEEPEIRDDNESLTTWRLSLKEAIWTTTDVPPVLSEDYDRLENIFKLNQGNEEALGIELNNFIAHLYETIKKIKNIEINENNKNRKKLQIGNKKNSRNARKRFSYARCQDVFKECPKKLTDVMNDDRAYLEPARQQ